MPRKRLRPDYVIRNYSYACTIAGPVPQVVWDTARHMQNLWNMLVEMHDKILIGWDNETPKQVKTAAYDAFWRDAYTCIKDQGDTYGLSCWQKWHILDTFKDAQKRWSKKRGGRPSVHYGLKKILIPHRTDSGGVDANWLFTDHERKHTALLEPKPGRFWRKGYMTIGNERVPLRVLMHRDLPEGAILKRVALVGRYEPSFRTERHNGWEWQFLASIEMPAPTPAPPARRALAIDFGWRVRKDGIRVAVVTDGEHFWELVLPFDLANNHMRRREKHFQALHLPLTATGDWRKLWDMQSDIDLAMETCKKKLAAIKIDHWPDEAQMLMSHVHSMRAKGLRTLRQILYTSGMTVGYLEEWHKAHTVALRIRRSCEIHCQRSRNALYRNFADWIARHADTVIWEEDLHLRDIAETPNAPTDYGLKHSQKYRQMAGVSTLRQYIRESLKKYGRTLLDTKSPRTCSVCLAPMVKSKDLEVACEDGHWEDVDINNALTLFRAIPVAQRRMMREMPAIDRDQLKRGLRILA
jgi:hypothetical protein